MKIQKLVFSLLPITIVFLFPNYSFAKPEFTTSHNVTYDINKSGTTQVNQEITITNNTPSFYVSSYKLDITYLNIYDVEAFDKKGNILEKVDNKDNNTSIYLQFNEKVVGDGSKLNYTIRYKTKDIAQKNGLVWSVNIPKITPQEEIESYKVVIRVPRVFGEEMYMTPKAIDIKRDSGFAVYEFDKSQVSEQGISAAFGEFQLFYYKLKYSIRNLNPIMTKREVALPPDVFGRQKIYYLSMNIPPDNIYIDGDGNYIAEYNIPAGSKKEIVLEGLVKVFNKNIDINQGANPKLIPEVFLKNYTKQDRYWETEDPAISEKASELTRNYDTVTEKAYEIFKYVVNDFEYNFERIGSKYSNRYGAKAAIKNPKNSICTEFTDTTIALMRSAGIPSRELNGYGYSLDDNLRPLSFFFNSEEDILHSWLEFYDPNLGWVQVDPTWENTSNVDYFSKLDTNHIIFVRKGLSSEYPLPAGAYKSSRSDGKQIEILLSREAPPDFYQLTGRTLGKTIYNLVKKVDNVEIRNNGNVTAFDAKIEFHDGKILKIGTLPPYSKKTIVKSNTQKIKSISYLDFEGKLKTEELNLQESGDKLVLFSESFGSMLRGFTAPLLYTILVLLLIRLKFIRKTIQFLQKRFR